MLGAWDIVETMVKITKIGGVTWFKLIIRWGSIENREYTILGFRVMECNWI